ncbi:glycosyltransferase family 2 protein [bacterium]|nr:glycosyltransferase family 2 protein [bacterium]
MNYNISLFFPCYNEEDNIEVTIRKALKVLKSLTDTFEIIVVDDGSRDQTEKIVKRLINEDKRIKLIQHPQNKGYGAVLRTGLKNARYDLICFTDADGQFDFSQIREMLPLIGDAEVIIGYRRKRKDAFYRLVNAKIYGLVIRLFFGLKVRDVDCGFKLFRKKVIDDIEIEAQGALASAEILVKIKSKGYRIREIGVDHFSRFGGKSTGANLKVIFKAAKELFKFFPKLFSLRFEKYFKRKNRDVC